MCCWRVSGSARRSVSRHTHAVGYRPIPSALCEKSNQPSNPTTPGRSVVDVDLGGPEKWSAFAAMAGRAEISRTIGKGDRLLESGSWMPTDPFRPARSSSGWVPRSHRLRGGRVLTSKITKDHGHVEDSSEGCASDQSRVDRVSRTQLHNLTQIQHVSRPKETEGGQHRGTRGKDNALAQAGLPVDVCQPLR